MSFEFRSLGIEVIRMALQPQPVVFSLHRGGKAPRPAGQIPQLFRLCH